MNNKIKNYCYAKQCGPVVETGFHLNTYLVCKECKEEITKRLADEIESRNNKKNKEIVPDGNDDFMDAWATINGYSIPSSKDGGPDPDDYI